MSEESASKTLEGKSNNTVTIVALIAGMALILVLLCCVVIAMLAILGPQFGNVLSQITFELENPAAAIVPRLS